MTNQILAKIDVRQAFLSEKVDRDYVLPSFPLGKVGILASAGGTGKSFYALQACFQVAAGRHCDFALGGVMVKNQLSKVLYISLEDEEVDVIQRLRSIWQYWKEDKEKSSWLDDIADFVDIYPLAGRGVVLIDESCKPTDTLREIYKKALEMQGLRLIVVDTLRRAHNADENSNSHMSQILAIFEQIAKGTGASVLLLHHENKSGMRDTDAGASAVRGASALVDNCRYVMRLQTMTPDDAKKRDLDDDERRFYVRASLEKTNYGPPQAAAWLKRCEGGVLIACDLDSKEHKGVKSTTSWRNQDD